MNRPKLSFFKSFFFINFGFLSVFSYHLMAQSITQLENELDSPEVSVLDEPQSLLWLGSYGTFRLSENLYWHAELHYRRRESENQLFYGKMAQIYNRHGLKYIPVKNFSATLGGVLRIDFGEQEGEGFNDVVLEPRIWHEYIWTMPFNHFRIYHRLRIEHRWKRGFEKGASYDFRNRWRYKFLMKIPLNKPNLEPGAFYFSPDIELIMQSGKPVTDDPFEDLRIFPTFAYIASPRLTYSTGLMYTTGQTADSGFIYKQRWVLRFNVYFNLDLRKFDQKIPETNILD